MTKFQTWDLLEPFVSLLQLKVCDKNLVQMFFPQKSPIYKMLSSVIMSLFLILMSPRTMNSTTVAQKSNE